MLKEKFFRDPVHDLIPFDLTLQVDRTLLALMDCAEVQRLRRIKQLGMAHMAYQGAEHSRFAHSIGVLHVLRRMLARLTREFPVDEGTQLAVMAAGLLHDLGHGPFSHVMEKFFREHHEMWTQRVLLDESTEVNRTLRAYDSNLPQRVVDVLTGEATPIWINSLISSQMDADRFDYLLRDSHMTGVKYGIFDFERLLLLLRVSEEGDRVVVASKGLLPVEKYLQSRYQMYRQVYFHKTVTAAEAMLMALLARARDVAAEGPVPGVMSGSPLDKLLREESLLIEEFLALDDAVLFSAMNAWRRCSDTILANLADRLLNRRLFKSLEIQTDEESDLLFNTRLNSARDFLESNGLDFRYYLRFSKSSDTPYRPYSGRGKSSTIWIQDALDPAKLHDVSDLSPTIKAFTESPYTIVRAFFPHEANGKNIRTELTKILKD